MGGYGSGRRRHSEPTTSDFLQLDIREWQRKGRLVAGHSFSLWGWGGVAAARAKVRIETDYASLCYDRYRFERGWLAEQFVVRLNWTPCNYGGARAWFLCPIRSCGRRVAILYAGATLACRRCHQLSYPSQQQSRMKRRLYRSQEIRMKLGGSPNITLPFPEKPTGMHWRTYQRLKIQATQYEQVYLGNTMALLATLKSTRRRARTPA
jgi:hypothetical protein